VCRRRRWTVLVVLVLLVVLVDRRLRRGADRVFGLDRLVVLVLRLRLATPNARLLGAARLMALSDLIKLRASLLTFMSFLWLATVAWRLRLPPSNNGIIDADLCPVLRTARLTATRFAARLTTARPTARFAATRFTVRRLRLPPSIKAPPVCFLRCVRFAADLTVLRFRPPSIRAPPVCFLRCRLAFFLPPSINAPPL